MNRTRKPPPATQEQLITALLPDVHAEPPPPSPAPLSALPAPTLPTSAQAGGPLVGMAPSTAPVDSTNAGYCAPWRGRLNTDSPSTSFHRPARTFSTTAAHSTYPPPHAACAASTPAHRSCSPLPEQTLVIHPAGVVARLMATHYADLAGARSGGVSLNATTTSAAGPAYHAAR
jgi:hypothetical protein